MTNIVQKQHSFEQLHKFGMFKSFNSLFQSSVLAHSHGKIICLIHCPSPCSNQVLGTNVDVRSPFVPVEPLPPS